MRVGCFDIKPWYSVKNEDFSNIRILQKDCSCSRDHVLGGNGGFLHEVVEIGVTSRGVKVGDVCAGALENNIAVVSSFWSEIGSSSEIVIREPCIFFE